MATALRSQRNFQLLWGGQVISNVGGQLTLIALPAAIVIVLGATPMQAGALQAVECGIIPLFALFAGVVIDRFPRRPLMIGANIVRGLALASLPAAFALHHGTLAQFFIVSFVVGVASAVFDTTAANRTLVWGMLPLGALAGGTIALAAASWMLACPKVALDTPV